MLFDEVDYWSELSPEDAAWLRQFNRAFHQGFVPQDYPEETKRLISRSRDAFRRDAFYRLHRQADGAHVCSAPAPSPDDEVEARQTLERVIRHGGLGE